MADHGTIPGTTAQFPLHKDETFIKCPYDSSHRILQDKFLLHIRKCRSFYEKRMKEQDLPLDIEICPYDYKHHLPSALMAKHVKEECIAGINCGMIKNVLFFAVTAWRRRV